MTVYAFVHGAWQGAWCWNLVMAEFRRRGHVAVAADLPVEDPGAGVEAYVKAVLEGLPDEGGDVVLIGHAHGGLTVPVIAQSLGTRVHRMVFLAPLFPYPGKSHNSTRAAEPDRLMPGLNAGQLRDEDGSTTWQPQAAVATMYPDAPPDLAEWAAGRLRRQHWRVSDEVSPLTAWPDTAMSVIACANDAVVNPDWVRRTARVRFGVEAFVLPGDHSPFLARPIDLADAILRGS